MSWATKRKNMENQGKVCKTPGCNRKARAKGYCLFCYNLRRRNKNGGKYNGSRQSRKRNNPSKVGQKS